MKKVILSVLSMLVVASVSFAQQRLVILEHFTNASCPPCALYNPALNALLEQNLDKVVSIKYQASWPGVDPMNAANPTDVQSRVTYYNVTGVPNSVMDGNFYNGSPTGVTQSKIDQRHIVAGGIRASVKYSIIDSPDPVADSIVIVASVVATQSVAAGLILQTAAIEREISFTAAPGTNGEKKFESVMKKMFPSPAGTTLPAMAAGDSLTYTFKWSLVKNGTPVYYNIGQAAAVCFVQNNTTKAILNAAYDEPRPWLSLTSAENAKTVRIKATDDVSFPFNAVSKTAEPQIIKLKASVTGLPAGWNASIVVDGSPFADSALIALDANSTKAISVKISGSNDGVMNKKVSVKVEANSVTILPSVKNTMTFTVVSPSNIMYMDLAGTGTSKFTAAFGAAAQAFVSLNAAETPNLDMEGLTASAVKKIYYSTGALGSGTLTESNTEVFTSYLNSGGNLFVMGQDIGYELAVGGSPAGQDFYSQYMAAEYVGDGLTTSVSVTGIAEEPLLGVHVGAATFSMVGSTNYPDQLGVSGGALGTADAFLVYSAGNDDTFAGVYNFTDTWKVVYVGFRMEAIGTSAAAVAFRNKLILTSNNWFDNILTANELTQEMNSSTLAYPNPVKGQLNVPVSKGSEKIILTNLAGQNVREIKVDATQPAVNTISLNGVPAGIYFLQVQSSGSKPSSQKIVVE